MRIAWFTPYYSASAIGTYGEVIVDELLAAGHDVAIFAPRNPQHGGIRPTRHRCIGIGSHCDAETLAHVREYDIAVYNMGDNFLYHEEVYEYLRACPGIVVLHDLVLRDFFWAYCLLKLKSKDSLFAMLYAAHGPEALEHGRQLVDGLIPDSLDDPGRLMWPLYRPALSNALGVVVHSKYSLQRLSEAGIPSVQQIEFPCFGPMANSVHTLPSARSAKTSGIRILTFGYLNSNKLIHATIEAIGASPLLRRSVTFEIIGEGNPDYRKKLGDAIGRLGLQASVKIVGYQSDATLRQRLQEADIVVNLRCPHMGESSATLLCSLLAGVPTIVWKHGYYAEFPEDIVCQIDRVDALRGVLERLVQDLAERLRRGAESRLHAWTRFRTERYVTQLLPFAERLAERRVPCLLIDHASRCLKEMGAVVEDYCTRRIAQEIARFNPASNTA